MKHRTSEILFNYWNEVRNGRLAPRRFDIEPARIAPILSETMILEHAAPGAYRFRLAGTRIVDQFGAELRGADFIGLWQLRDRQRIQFLLADLAAHGGCGLLTFEGASAGGHSAVFEAVLLPLIHTRDVVDRFVGAISCAQSQSWMGAGHPIEALHLIEHRLLPVTDPEFYAPPNGAERQPPVFHPAIGQGRIVRTDRRQFRVLDGGLSTNGRDEG